MGEERIAAIRTRYRSVLEAIDASARRSGRSAEKVRLVVVSKSQSVETIRAAIDAGVRILGENYVGEALEKMATMRDSRVEWHMIGHLQSRKADEVGRSFQMLHSLDSLRLASRLDRVCSALGRKLPVLLEFNVSGEESKFGFPAGEEAGWPRLLPEIGEIVRLPALKIAGLMTMPPYSQDPEEARPFFRRLTRMQEFLASAFPATEWGELSMGTSADFTVAVEEGATLVRVGTAILGPRTA